MGTADNITDGDLAVELGINFGRIDNDNKIARISSPRCNDGLADKAERA